MFKLVADDVWCFDAEWVPDFATGRRVYGIDASVSDEEVLDRMWKEGGATEDDPRPYLKTVLCRVVSIAAVRRRREPTGAVRLVIHTLPKLGEPAADEATVIDAYLSAVGKNGPQLVGFNSIGADIKILIQRALVNRLREPEFSKRPGKPWEGRDYFAKGSDWHIDLKEELGGWSRPSFSLHDLATACGIPGKIGVDGSQVIDLWRGGEIRKIVQYNICDAASTYLIWLRAAAFGGHVTQEQVALEERQLAERLGELAADPANDLIRTYLGLWSR